jgi:excisionase family DNA binding protein
MTAAAGSRRLPVASTSKHALRALRIDAKTIDRLYLLGEVAVMGATYVSSKSSSTRPLPELALVSVFDAAARYGVHPDTIRRRIADGTIRGYQVGGKALRVDLHDCDAKLLRRVGGDRD